MRVQIIAAYYDDAGAPIWTYEHGENVPRTGDAEEMALTALGVLHRQLGTANEAIGEQAKADLKRIQDEAGEREDP